MCKWRRIKKDFNISVNVSYVQLQERTIVDDVIEAAKEADLPGNLITVEITESMQLRTIIISMIFFTAGEIRECISP